MGTGQIQWFQMDSSSLKDKPSNENNKDTQFTHRKLTVYMTLSVSLAITKLAFYEKLQTRKISKHFSIYSKIKTACISFL